MAIASSDSNSSKRSTRPQAAAKSAAPAAKRPRRWPRRVLIALAGYALLMWALPILLAWTPLRNRPLAMALPGLNGTVTSGGASLGWFSPVVFSDVEIRDAAGNLLISAAAIRTDKTLLQLALSQTELGTIRIEQPNLALEMRRDGSNAEDVLLPWLKGGNGGADLTIGLEFVDGTINLHDVPADRRWKIEQYQTSLKLGPKNPVPLECAISGNAIIDNKPAHFAVSYKQQVQSTKDEVRNGVAATQSAAPGSAPVAIQAQVEPLPLEMFRPLVARVLPDAQVTGRLSANLQYQTAAAQADAKTLLAGQAQVDGLNLSAAALGADRLHLDSLQVPCRIAWQGRQIDVQQLGIRCDVGQLAISGQTTLPDNVTARSFADWLHESFTVQGELDLAQLAKLLPATLHVRQGIQIVSGDVKLALASDASGGSHRWSGQLQASNITATNAGRPVTWDKPISVNLAAHDAATGPVVDKFDCQSSFVHIAGSGTVDQFTAEADCDLNKLATELGQFVDLGNTKPAGDGQATLDFQRSADGGFRAV
ncbi:MAG TPA: DUF748 domain-containing protein, partial [Pirellulales bacterium]|nr:DUF748 domain-containing protein [Pirellulales bacterium]